MFLSRRGIPVPAAVSAPFSPSFLDSIPHFREIFLAAFFCAEESYGRREIWPGSSVRRSILLDTCVFKCLISVTPWETSSLHIICTFIVMFTRSCARPAAAGKVVEYFENNHACDDKTCRRT